MSCGSPASAPNTKAAVMPAKLFNKRREIFLLKILYFGWVMDDQSVRSGSVGLLFLGWGSLFGLQHNRIAHQLMQADDLVHFKIIVRKYF